MYYQQQGSTKNINTRDNVRNIRRMGNISLRFLLLARRRPTNQDHLELGRRPQTNGAISTGEASAIPDHGVFSTGRASAIPDQNIFLDILRNRNS